MKWALIYTSAFLGGLGLLIWLSVGPPKHPSDEKLIKNFLNNEKEFEELLDMVSSDDGVRRIDYNWGAQEIYNRPA